MKSMTINEITAAATKLAEQYLLPAPKEDEYDVHGLDDIYLGNWENEGGLYV